MIIAIENSYTWFENTSCHSIGCLFSFPGQPWCVMRWWPDSSFKTQVFLTLKLYLVPSLVGMTRTPFLEGLLPSYWPHSGKLWWQKVPRLHPFQSCLYPVTPPQCRSVKAQAMLPILGPPWELGEAVVPPISQLSFSFWPLLLPSSTPFLSCTQLPLLRSFFPSYVPPYSSTTVSLPTSQRHWP